MSPGEIPATSPTLLRALRGPDNDEAAWRTFLARYQPLIETWCRRAGLSAADADEVGSRVLAKLVQALRAFRYDPAHRFRSWLRTVVLNEVRTYRRDRGRRPGEQGSGDTAVHDRLEQAEGRGDFDALVRELEEGLARDQAAVIGRVQARVDGRTWRVFWQTAVEARPAAEVAREQGLSVAAAYMGKSRVLAMLREEGRRPERGDAGCEPKPT